MSTLGILNDRYQLEQTLGTGGMAIVYKAKDLMLERYVAVKALREDFSQDVAFRERFRQEAKAAANLSHPNIVTVHDFGLDQKHLFIVMEYMPGTDLKTLIKQKERFSVNETLELMVQACGGVGYAHRAGLVHCDIKPHNMLVTPESRLKVTDFGIARALSTISPDERSEVVWGSPHYFSPEQASGLPPSPASDVYSLGVILYEMLAGRLPFIASDSSELARMHREDQPVAPRYYNTSIPARLEEIILKVLSKEPSARYRTADQLGRLLMGMYESERAVSFPNENLQQLPKMEQVKPTPLPTQEAQPMTSIPYSERVTLQPEPVRNPITESTPVQTSYPPVEYGQTEPDYQERPPIDWRTWSLGLMAAVLLLGLIPFWFYVYLILKP